MKAVILAGGFGTRLQSVVSDRPKSMALIQEKPFLHYQIDYLKTYGFKEFVFCVGYKANQIIEYFGDGIQFDIEITYAIEEEPLGTAGAFKNADIDEPFLGLNGDSFLRVNFDRVLKFYHQVETPVVVCRKMEDVSRFGTVQFDDHQRITQFIEKNNLLEKEGWINGGIYILTPTLMATIPNQQKCSIEYDIFPNFIENGLYAYLSEDYFIDIGTPESYAAVQNDIKNLQI